MNGAAATMPDGAVTTAPRGAGTLPHPGAAGAHLLDLATALPPMCWTQAAAADRLARLWNLRGRDLDRWRRIIDGCGIHQRCGVMPVDHVIHLSTAQRMAAYERHAPPLAHEAAARALVNAGVQARDVTDLIVVSCTGFSAPGLDAALVERLSLPLTVRRIVVGFMGCFGAIIGLRAAMNACNADPTAVALVVCVELCTLHLRADPSPDNLVASALFADGAAAALVAGSIHAVATGPGGGRPTTTVASTIGSLVPPLSHLGAPSSCRPVTPSAPLGRLAPAHTLLIPEGRDWMTWRITDSGFAMTLTRDVPVALRRAIVGFVNEAPRRAASDDSTRCSEPPRTFIVHPGGGPILDAVDDALQLDGRRGLESARAVLRDCGNMSSPSVLFVLERALARRPHHRASPGCPDEVAGQRSEATPSAPHPLTPSPPHDWPALLLAFGPGLTIESLRLEPTVST